MKSGRLSPEVLLYFGVVVLLVVPMWTLRYALTQDGPMHLHNARILLDLWSSKGIDFYHDYYVPNFTPFPYWAGHLTLASLLSVFAPGTVEKIFFTGCILLYAISLWRLVTAINPEAGWVAIAGLALYWNRTFQMGFMDFSLSVGVMLAILAFYVRRRASLSYIHAAILSLLLVVLYFCHPVTFMFTIGAVGLLAMFAGARSLAFAVAAMIPSVALLLNWLIRDAPDYAIAVPTPYSTLLLNVLKQSNLTAWSLVESPIAIAVSVLFLVMIVMAAIDRVRRRSIEMPDAFLIAAAAALIVQLYGSARMIGFFERFQFVPLLMLLPWFAAQHWPPVSRRALMGAAALIVVAFVVARYPRQVFASQLVEQITSVQPRIEPRSTLLVMNFDFSGRRPDGLPDNDYLPIFLHAGEYIGSGDRRMVVLNNVGGLYPMFPYLWRADRNPFQHLQTNEGIEFDPPGANFISYQARTGGTVDYVAAIGFDSSPNKDQPNARAFAAQIAAGYTAVFRSPDGRVTLYRTKAPAPPTVQDAATWLNYSLALYQVRRFQDSIAAAKQVLAIEPASDRAYNNICAASNAMEEWDQAIAACNQALKINPANQIAKNNLAWANSRR